MNIFRLFDPKPKPIVVSDDSLILAEAWRKIALAKSEQYDKLFDRHVDALEELDQLRALFHKEMTNAKNALAEVSAVRSA